MASPVGVRSRLPTDKEPRKLHWLRWLVIALWALAVILLGHAATSLSSATNDTAAAYLPGSAQSTKVATLQSQALGGAGQPESDQAVAVFARDTPLTPADRNAIAAADRAVAVMAGRVPGLGRPSSVVPSSDRKAELFTVSVTAPQHQITTADRDAVKAIRSAIAAQLASAPGIQEAVTGPAAVTADSGNGGQSALLATSVIIVAVILLLVYRSPVLWLLPLVSAINAIVLAEAAAHGLAKAGLTVSSLSSAILTVLVFGAATDYALLLVHRYREELRHHPSTAAAMAVALKRTYGTLLASSATVIVAMLCMLAASSGSLHGLGPVAAVAVGAAFLAQTTLLPALLLVFGRWVFWPRIPRPGDPPREESSLWSQVGRQIARRPGSVALVTVLLLGAAATALTGLHFTSNPTSTLKGSTGAAAGQQLVDAHFPAGAVAPLTVLASPVHAAAARAAVASVPGVSSVTAGKTVAGYDSFTVTTTVNPYGVQGSNVIRSVRDRVSGTAPGSLVGGSPAVQMDIADAASRDDAVLIPLILGVVLIVIMLLLRAFIAPLLLVAISALSFAASFGLADLLWGALNYQGVDPQVPIYIFLFLVALGVDYNIFLIARVREETRTLGTKNGTLRGLAVTGGVITAAGVVLAGTFAALTQLPSLSISEVGSAVAIGVLIDTLIVRSVLAPSLILRIGDAVWLPGHPARRAPRAGGTEPAMAHSDPR